MSPMVGQIALAVYALLLAAGGIMGYVKAGSRPSLIAGLLSGLIAAVALVMTLLQDNPRPGLLLGMTLAFLLAAMFLRRLGITRKFMPSGMLALVSIAMVVLLLMVLV